MSKKQALDALRCWTEEDVHILIQRTLSLEHCDPAELNVFQVHDHIDFVLEEFHAMT